MSRLLVKNIIYEYCIPLIAIVLIRACAYLAANSSDQKGIDGLGNALGIVIIMRVAIAIVAVIFLIVNPIRILVTYRQELAAVIPALKKAACIALISVPILASIPLIFSVPISNFIYDRKYNSGKGSYAAVEENYRTPAQFRDELISRGLYLTEKAEMRRLILNSKFERYTGGDFEEYYYDKATMMPLTDERFYDITNNKKILDPDTESNRYPAYIYNAVLLQEDGFSDLKYEPYARYDDKAYLNGNDYPFFTDFYIECKIMYVDGDIYAVIGVSESYDIAKSYDTFERPFYMILAEKDDITTYFEGKYYPYGAIENMGGDLEMHPNTTENPYSIGEPVNYPVRNVGRLDIDAINKVANELKNGILKEIAESHFGK